MVAAVMALVTAAEEATEVEVAVTVAAVMALVTAAEAALVALTVEAKGAARMEVVRK